MEPITLCEKVVFCPNCEGDQGEIDNEGNQDVQNCEKPFNCAKCDSTFACLNTLKAHESKEHEEIMRKHENTRNKEKPFSCLQCDKNFECVDSLKTHEKQHGENLNNCSSCSQSFEKRIFAGKP